MRITRRKFGASALALVAAPAIVRAQAREIVIGGPAPFGTLLKEHFFARFEKSHKCKVLFEGAVSLTHLEKMRANKARPSYSIVMMDDPVMVVADNEGLLGKITLTIVVIVLAGYWLRTHPEALQGFRLPEIPPRPPRVAFHHQQVGTDMRCEIDLVDHEQVRVGDAGASLARDLVALGDVDHEHEVVRERPAEGERQVVAPGLDEHDVAVREAPLELCDRVEVHARVVANGGVGTGARLDAHDALGREQPGERGSPGLYLVRLRGCAYWQTATGRPRHPTTRP